MSALVYRFLSASTLGGVAGFDHLADNQQTGNERSIVGFFLGYVEALSFSDSGTPAT